MKDNAESLINKYIEGSSTSNENAIVEAGFLNDYKSGYTEVSREEIESSTQRIAEAMDSYLAPKNKVKKEMGIRKVYFRMGITAAAAVILLFCWWSYIDLQQRQAVDDVMATIPTENISNSKGNGATITLSNGKTIALSDLQEGVVIGDGSLRYDDGSAVEDGSSVEYDKLTATTAKGQTYSFSLPDGTKVWLNTASEITITQPYGRSKREIYLKGEAYFEVAKNKKAPFIVQSEGQKIEVLGTHFNVKAYPNIAKRTSLLEGKIQLAPSANDKYTLLLPGQESYVSGSRMTIKETDVEASISWRSGLFNFDDKPFTEIMQEISDWYDLDIVYKGKIPKGTFFGQAYKSDNLATVLQLLESAKLDYKVSMDRKLIISNKAL